MKQKKQKEEKVDKKKKDETVIEEDNKADVEDNIEQIKTDEDAYGEIIDLDSAYGRDKLKELNKSEEKEKSGEDTPDDVLIDEDLKDDSDEDTAENQTDEAASKGLKAVGIVSICIAALGFLAMGALVYFLAIKPPYIKEKSDRDFDIMYVTTRTDAISVSDVVLLSTPSDVNFDAIGDTVAEIDANAKEYPTEAASDTDATATDAGYEDATFSDAPSEDF